MILLESLLVFYSYLLRCLFFTSADKVIYSSPNFDPKVFLSWVHKDTSAADLEAGALTLKTDLKGRTQQKKQLVKENFDCFVSCKTTIDGIYLAVRSAAIAVKCS
jgi:hypothetical protein